MNIEIRNERGLEQPVRVVQMGFFKDNKYKPETGFKDIPHDVVLTPDNPIFSKAVRDVAEETIQACREGHWHLDETQPRGPMLVMEEGGFFAPLWGMVSQIERLGILVNAGAGVGWDGKPQGRYEQWSIWKTAEEVDLWIKTSFHWIEGRWLGGMIGLTSEGKFVTHGAAVGFMQWRIFNEAILDVLRDGQNHTIGRDRGLSVAETGKLFNKMFGIERFCAGS